MTYEVECRGRFEVGADGCVSDAESLDCCAFVAGVEEGAVVVLVVRAELEVEGFAGDVVLGQRHAGEKGAGEEGGELHLCSVLVVSTSDATNLRLRDNGANLYPHSELDILEVNRRIASLLHFPVDKEALL